VSLFRAIAVIQNLASTGVQSAVREKHGLPTRRQRRGSPMNRPVTAMRAFRFFTSAQCYQTGQTLERARGLPTAELGLFQHRARTAPWSPVSAGTPQP